MKMSDIEQLLGYPNMNELEKLFAGSSVSGSATMKAIMVADKLSSTVPTIPDTIGEQYRRMVEEEKAQRGRWLMDALPKPVGQLYAEQFGTAGSLAESLQRRETNYLDRIIGRSVDRVGDIIGRLDKVGSLVEALEIQNQKFRSAIFGMDAVEKAKELAFASQHLHLDDYLDNLRTSVGPLTDKMLYLGSLDSIRSPEKLKAFVHASTVSDILESSLGFGWMAQQALESLTRQAIPNFDSVQEYGHMLRAAGLSLPHWPQPRLLTIGERRRRLRHRINNVEKSPHAKKAWSVFERYEQVLREIIDDAMARRYGEEWPRERLPKCGCNSLLRKWIKRGGDLFEHADFAQYIDIMCDEEHFEAIFSNGFDDREVLKELLTRAKSLRAAVMHFHKFTKEHLRDVRTTWKAIEAGLLGLTSKYEMVYH